MVWQGTESRVYFMMGPTASYSQIVRNDVVKRTNVQVAEKRGDNCRTVFLSRGRNWILCTKGRFALTWRTVIHAKLREVYE